MITQRTGLWSHLRASERKRWLHLEWFADVSRKRLTEAVDLLLHLRHGKVWPTGLENAHMSYKELPGVAVYVRIGASDGDL
jgi:hypothetical protein